MTISNFAIQDIMTSLGSDNIARCRMTNVCRQWQIISTAECIPRECWDAGRMESLVHVTVSNFRSAHMVFAYTKQDIFENLVFDICWWGLAIQSGDVHFLEYIFHEFKITPDDARFRDNDAIWRSAMSGHLGVLRFLRQTCQLTTEDARSNNNAALRYAARGGYSDILVHLHDDWGLTLDDAHAAFDGLRLYATARKPQKTVFKIDVMNVLYKVFKMPNPNFAH